MDDLSSQIADTGKIPQLPASQIKIPEDANSALTVSQQGMGSDLDNLASSVGGQLVRSMSKIPEAEREKAAAAKTEATGEAEQWTSYQKELRDIYKNSAPTPLSTQAAPKLPDDDPVRNFGSLASMIGIFASAFTKKPIVNALNASADAMKAEQAGNREAYDRAYQEWKDQTDLAFKRHGAEVEQLNEIMELAGKDQTAALAKLKAYGVVNSSDAASTLAELGDWEEIGKYAASMQTMKTKAQEAALKMEEQNTKRQVYQDSLEANIAAGQPKAIAEQNALSASLGKATASGAGVTWSDDAIKMAADAVARGVPMMRVVPGYGRVNPNRDAVMNYLAQNHPEVDLATVESQFGGLMQEARTTGGISGRIKFAANSLDQSLPLLEEAASKVDLSKFTDLNALENYARGHTSNKNLSELVTAIQATVNDYSSLIARNGVPTDATRSDARRLINENMGKGSLEGFIEQVRKEKAAQLKASAESTGRESISSKESSLPDEAKKQLKKGTHTTFGNGQVWTLDDNGEPQQVQ